MTTERRESMRRAIWEGKRMPPAPKNGHRPSLFFCGKLRHQKEVAELVGATPGKIHRRVKKGMKIKEILRSL